MDQKKKIILLAGPTASGKSKLAIKMAKEINGEIINADSMQVYTEISILSSKPSLSDLKIVRHHLYGFHSVKKDFSTGIWLNLATKKIKKLLNLGKSPIIVGGTGLYFKSLTEGLAQIPQIPEHIKTSVRKLQREIGQKEFFRQLTLLDSQAKKFLIKTDVQRSIRAYEVKKFTSNSVFSLIKRTKPYFENKMFIKFFINPPREHLHRAVDERVEKMFKKGAVDEVKNFLKIKLNTELSVNKILGIREIEEYIDRKITLDEAKDLIKLRTRQYVKRQFTWSRGHMTTWDKIYSANFNDLLKKAINKIS